MFARKKPAPAKGRKHDLSQFGLTDIPDDFDPTGGIGNDDDDAVDSDLEAELAAISGGNGNRPKPKPKPKLVAASDLDRMVADSLRDIGSDEEMSGDENDPDLLGELQDITGGGDIEVKDESPDEITSPAQEEPQQIFLPTTTVDTMSIIKERIEMYTLAEDNAKIAGEAAKARRFNRGLKTLKDLLKQAASGKQINVDDIPPEVGVKTAAKPTSTNDETSTTPTQAEAPKVPSRSAPPPPAPVAASPEATAVSSDDPKSTILGQLFARQKEYKTFALNFKRAGDTTNALQFIKVVKQFDLVIKMCQDGQEVDLSDMPPPPEEFLEFLAKMQAAAEVPPAPESVTSSVAVPAVPSVASSETANETTPVSILEALQQRLEKCKSVAESAKAESNASKARRWGRIVKQYEDAVKLYKAGRPVPYDELPAPPGFEPFPVGGGSELIATTSTPSPPPVPPKPSSTTPTSPASISNASSPSTTPKEEPKRPPHKLELTSRITGNQQTNNLVEQQMKLLLDRQKEFKVAAVQAKKAGEIDQAKEYLKIYKGFDALLNAASGGLPIDLTTLPVPPSQRDNLEASFAIVASEDCDPNDEDISDIGVRMEEQLAKQLMMCKNTRDHHKAMGDVAGMNRFENLALTVQKDLDLIRYSKRKKFPLPKFHYEKKSFNIVHCNTDLTDNELEIVIVRGINYNVSNPKDVDTYIRIEVPLLNDEVFKSKTSVIKNTDSPDYDQRFKVDIIRGNRQFQRIFKRHGVKFEVYSRGGFLRSDILIGTVNVKLQPLETKCDIHDTYDLMDGRKAVGGKLEVKIRVRNPILTKQMEHIDEKWLVLDS